MFAYYFVFHIVSGQDDVFGDDVCNEVTVGKSIADVYALTYSDIHCIDRNDLRDVLMTYPESGVEFSSKLKLTFNLRHQVCNTDWKPLLLEFLSLKILANDSVVSILKALKEAFIYSLN